jgi:predicted Zn-dependent protease with MMP-like domain
MGTLRAISVDFSAVGDRSSIGDSSEARCVARQTGRVVDVSREAFESLVAEALDTLPAGIAGVMANLVIVVEDHAPADDPDLLGLYSGIPLTERDGRYAGVLPDQITIFRNPIVQMCDSLEEVVDEVRITVVHEIAHHFGIDDARLHELGYE